MPAITIQGQHYRISHPYAEGHALTAAEARALNTMRTNYIGTQMRRRIAQNAQWQRDEIEAELRQLDETYRFQPAEADRTVAETQFDKMLRQVAKEYAAEHARQDGIPYDALDMAAMVHKLSQDEVVQNEARYRLKIQNQIARKAVDEQGGL